MLGTNLKEFDLPFGKKSLKEMSFSHADVASLSTEYSLNDILVFFIKQDTNTKKRCIFTYYFDSSML